MIECENPHPCKNDLSTPVKEVKLNLNCRDDIIPVLRGLQQIYSNSILQIKILDLVAEVVNQEAQKTVVAKDWIIGKFSFWRRFDLAVIWITTNCRIWRNNTAHCATSWESGIGTR